MPSDAPVTIATRCALTIRGPIVGAPTPGKTLIVEILFHRPEESPSRSGISFSIGSYAAIPGGQRLDGEKNHENRDFDGGPGRRNSSDCRRGESPAARCSVPAGCDSRQ